jgi:hypothetical protein
MRPTPHQQQPNNDDERARAEGHALDMVMANVVYLTIQYAQSFERRTWDPTSFSTLFQVRDEFSKN